MVSPSSSSDAPRQRRPKDYAAISWLLAFLACLYVGTSMVRLYYQKRQLEDQVAQQLQNISVSMKRSLAL
ncbi:hypothetical protein, partial [Rugamonas fusca]|uniref:hypothetical protein n=1 Tax=Rugamonas fusca TaxID=2758568 RepID=UPI001C70CFF6